jgi:hypothetical protein
MKKPFIIFIILFISFLTSFSQDKIYRQNGEIIKAKVLEIGTSEVKYKDFSNLDGPVYVIETERIKKIEFENGKIEKFNFTIGDKELYGNQLHKAVKFDFLGPLLGYAQFGFEKSIAPGRGYELTLGIIGLGKSQSLEYYYGNGLKSENKNQFGIVVSAGYKFNKLPDFLFGKTRMTHLLQGAYAKPIIYLGNYSENKVAYKGNNQYVIDRQNISIAALHIELGKQWVLGDKVLIDTYWGFGYGADNKKATNDYYSYGDSDITAYNYINTRLGRSPGFSLNFGLKIGMLIK